MFTGGRGSTPWRVRWIGFPSIPVRCLLRVLWLLLVFCLALLHLSHWAATHLRYTVGRSLRTNTKKKKTSNFLIISAERWAIAIPCKQSLHFSGGFRGGARGTRVPLLFLDQTEARRAEKSFWRPPPSPYLRVWMTTPPPLISRSGYGTAFS